MQPFSASVENRIGIAIFSFDFSAVVIFLGGQTSPMTVETLEKHIDIPQILQAKLDDPVRHVDVGVVAGLVLGAPEFQRR